MGLYHSTTSKTSKPSSSSSSDTSLSGSDDVTFGTNDGEVIDYRITSLPSWSPASWMGDLAPHIRSTPLMQLRMVGSHDSNSYGVTSDSQTSKDGTGIINYLAHNPSTKSVASRVLPPWCKCQDLTLLQQLEQGVRYLDFRTTPNLQDNGGNMWTMHSLFAQPLRKSLTQVIQYVDRFPSEFIILDLQHVEFMDNPSNAYERLASDLFVLDSYALPTRFVTSTTTLNDIYNLGGGTRRILVLIENGVQDHLPAEMKSWITPRDSILMSVYYDQPSSDSLLSDMKRAWNAYENSSDSHRTTHFDVLQTVLTPTDSTITSGLFNFGPDSIEELTDNAASSLIKFFASCAATPMRAKATQDGGQLWSSRGNRFQNIVLLNYFEQTRVTVWHERQNINSIQRYNVVTAVELCALMNIELAAKNQPLMSISDSSGGGKSTS